MKELGLRDLQFLRQQQVLIEYKGLTREEPLRLDVVVEGCVLVERRPSKGSSQSIKPSF
jgi:hypothetical protein